MKTAARNVMTRLGALTILLMLVMGCMLEPGDTEEVEAYCIYSTGTTQPGFCAGTVDFRGYSWGPDEVVTIEYRNRFDSRWHTLGTTRSRNTGSTVDGITGYFWGDSFTVPYGFFEGCGEDTAARVRGRVGSSYLYSIVPDWSGCWRDHGSNWSGFISNCFAPLTPISRIKPSQPNYCGGGGPFPNGEANECEHADDEPCMAAPGDCPENVQIAGKWICNESNGQNTCDVPGPGSANGYCVSGLDPSQAPGCPNPRDNQCTRNSDCQPSLYCGPSSGKCINRPQPYSCNVPFCWLYSQQDSVCP